MVIDWGHEYRLNGINNLLLEGAIDENLPLKKRLVLLETFFPEKDFLQYD